MSKLLLPLTGFIVAIALFVVYTKPTFEATKAAQAEKANYEQAIGKATELRARVDELVAQINNFSPNDLSRLDSFLPDTINVVDFVMSMDGLADRHRMLLGGIKISEGAEAASAQSNDDEALANKLNPLRKNRAPANPANIADPAIDGGDPLRVSAEGNLEEAEIAPPYQTIALSFAVTGKYDDFRAFLADVERNLLLTDVKSLSIGNDTEGDLEAYQVTVNAYEFIGAPQ